MHFFVSQAAYGATDSDAGLSGYGDGVVEIQRQIDANRDNLSSGYTGSVFFHTSAYIQLFRDIRESHFTQKALPPAMDWKVKECLTAPVGFVLTDSILSWSHAKAERFTVYAFPREISLAEGMSNPLYLKKIVYGNQFNLIGLGDISKLSIVVCSYDRYGKEHEAAVYEGEGVFEYPQVIFWELNGGTVDVELPKYVTETYVLPIPTKVGHEFGGWYKAKTFRGKPITEIVEGWEGTLYAKWTVLSAVENIEMEKSMRVYDTMGRLVGKEWPKEKGVYIVEQGAERVKIVL